MRLINADALKEYSFRPYSNEESYSNIELERIIDAQPTIDMLELAVRSEYPWGSDKPHDFINKRLEYYSNRGAKMR